MPRLISQPGDIKHTDERLTSSKIRRFVGESFKFHRLLSDDVLIHAERGGPNDIATTIANFEVTGNVIICREGEIA